MPMLQLAIMIAGMALIVEALTPLLVNTRPSHVVRRMMIQIHMALVGLTLFAVGAAGLARLVMA